MYDFDEIVDRRNTSAVKWNIAQGSDSPPDDYIPMWIADMDFACAPPIIEAIRRAAGNRIFGYTRPPRDYLETVCEFYRRRHGFTCSPEQIVFTQGVVSELSCAVQTLTEPGDGVIVQPPVYAPFFSAVTGNGRVLLQNRLIYDRGCYMIDFDDLEKRASDPRAKMLIICSPHNPVGRVWTREELEKTADICLRNGVILVCDEIHNDLIRGGYRHFSVMELFHDQSNIVCCTSPGKTFNISGLGASHCFIPDPDKRQRISDAVGHVNISPLTVAAVEAAMTSCDDWIDELNAYTDGNFDLFHELCGSYFPLSVPVRTEGTYLAWLDVSAYTEDTKLLERKIMDECHVNLECGDGFGGHGFMRINLACPRRYISEAAERISKLA